MRFARVQTAVARLPILCLAMLSGCGSTVRFDPVTSLKAHGYVSSVAFSPSGSTLATAGGGWDKEFSRYTSGASLWNVALPGRIRSFAVRGQAQAIAFSPDGKLLAVADGDYTGSGHVFVFDAVTGDRLKSLDGRTGWVHGLTFSPDGRLLVTCGSSFGSNDQEYHGGRITVWEVTNWLERSKNEWREGTYRAVSFTQDGRSYVTGGGVCSSSHPEAGEVCLWDTATGEARWSRQGHAHVVECVAISPDGKNIASGAMDGVLKLWNANDGSESYAVQLGDRSAGRVFSAAFSPDGKMLAVAHGSHNRGARWGSLRVIEVVPRSGHSVSILESESPVTCVAFSVDGRWLSAGDSGGMVKVWEVAKLVLEHLFTWVECSPCGSRGGAIQEASSGLRNLRGFRRGASRQD
jgi:Tol biopolymer transport system component